MKGRITMGLIAVLVLSMTGVASAETVEGEVGNVGPDYVVIITYRDAEKGKETEYSFGLDSDVSYERVKNVSKLKKGDRIRITYEYEDRELKDGAVAQGTKIRKRKATKLTFVAPAKPALFSGEK